MGGIIRTQNVSIVRGVLATSPHFRALAPSLLDHIARIARVIALGHKKVLSTPSSKAGFWIVLSGGLQISLLSKSGNAGTLAVLGRGSFFSPGTLLGVPHAALECRALGGTSVASIPADELRRLVEDDRAFERHTAKLVVSCLDAALSLASDLVHLPLRQRLARRLLAQALAAGDVPAGQIVEVRVSQNLLAEMLGASRSSVHEELATLEQSEIVQQRYRALRILDVGRLRDIAGDEVPAL